MNQCAFDVRDDEDDKCRDSCGVDKEEPHNPPKCVIAKALPRSHAKRRQGASYACPNIRENKNKAQKESTTVGLEPTTLASQVIGGLRATICLRLALAAIKREPEDNLLRQAARSTEYDGFQN